MGFVGVRQEKTLPAHHSRECVRACEVFPHFTRCPQAGVKVVFFLPLEPSALTYSLRQDTQVTLHQSSFHTRGSRLGFPVNWERLGRR